MGASVSEEDFFLGAELLSVNGFEILSTRAFHAVWWKLFVGKLLKAASVLVGAFLSVSLGGF